MFAYFPCPLKKILFCSGLFFSLLVPLTSHGSTVTLQTSQGTVTVELFDTAAPLTVANFLAYVNAGAYNNSFFHRSIPGFILQGGGYVWDSAGNTAKTIPANAPVVNEFSASRSNLRGTIAMAKLGGNPDSATSQWFINLADNAANLDTQNGGFTVFGQVTGGMAVIDAIAALPTVNAGGAFTNLPVRTPPTAGAVTQAHLVMLDPVSLQAPPASGTVVEFYNGTLDHYFITADANEATAIDSGSAGAGWSRTGNTFKAGGTTPVCRFYGSLTPGPNSHFYTVDADECAMLKKLQAEAPATQKRWNFESLDFYATPVIPGNSSAPCASGTAPVYRAYNNGAVRGADSNHRITGNQAAIQQLLARGWIDEGVVMCAPQ